MGAGCCQTTNKNAQQQEGSLISCISKNQQPIQNKGKLPGPPAFQKKIARKPSFFAGSVIRTPTLSDLQKYSSDVEINSDPAADQEGQAPEETKAEQSLEVQVDDDTIKQAQIGRQFMLNYLVLKLDRSAQQLATKKSRHEKWYQMVTYLLDESVVKEVFEPVTKNFKLDKKCPPRVTAHAMIGLLNYFTTNMETFIARLAKGPPVEYRWLAWQFIGSLLKGRASESYGTYLKAGQSPDNEWVHQIEKDLNRTFPEHPYFNNDRYGSSGQAQLGNVLVAYSAYKPVLGYCQSMNFVAAFLLLVSGGREKETFWLFYQLLEKSTEPIAFDGLASFYENGFPLLMQYLGMFNDLFEEYLPEVFAHFKDHDIHDCLWVQKWFHSIFLYSFPMGLCIRIWDNILAMGTRFIFNISLAIIGLLQDQLLERDLVAILELFKEIKDEEGQKEAKLLPPYEDIITHAQQIDISDNRIKELYAKHKPKQQPKQLKKQIKKLKQVTITLPPKMEAPPKEVKESKELKEIKESKEKEMKELEEVKEPKEAKEKEPKEMIEIQEEDHPVKKIEADIDDQLSSTVLRKKKKKKKKKKKTTFEGELEILHKDLLGVSEAIPSINPNRVDEDRMQLEDIVNDNENHYIQEHHTDIFHIQPLPHQQEEQQAKSSGEDQQNGGSSAHQGSSAISIHAPKLVTYDDHPRRNNKLNLNGQMTGEKNYNIHHSARIEGQIYFNRTDQVNSSDSSKFNDFVIQRESMNFKRVPNPNKEGKKQIRPSGSTSQLGREISDDDINPPGSLGQSTFSTKTQNQKPSSSQHLQQKVMIGNLVHRQDSNQERPRSEVFEQPLPYKISASHQNLPRISNLHFHHPIGSGRRGNQKPQVYLKHPPQKNTKRKGQEIIPEDDAEQIEPDELSHHTESNPEQGSSQEVQGGSVEEEEDLIGEDPNLLMPKTIEEAPISVMLTKPSQHRVIGMGMNSQRGGN